MTTPTPTAHSAELQAAIERAKRVCLSLRQQAKNRFPIQHEGLQEDATALELILAALSQSSEAQRAVEAIAALELIMKTWKSYPQDNWDIQFERDCLPSVKAVLSQLPRPT